MMPSIQPESCMDMTYLANAEDVEEVPSSLCRIQLCKSTMCTARITRPCNKATHLLQMPRLTLPTRFLSWDYSAKKKKSAPGSVVQRELNRTINVTMLSSLIFIIIIGGLHFCMDPVRISCARSIFSTAICPEKCGIADCLPNGWDDETSAL